LEGNKDIFLNRLPENRFIEIFRLEALDTEPKFDNYQRYDFFQIIWFTKVGGNVIYMLDFKEYQLQENQIVLIFPGQIDSLDIRHKEGFLIAIHSDIFFNISQHINSDYLNGYYSNVFVSPDPKTKKILEQINYLILEEYEKDNRLILMENYLGAFLFHISALQKVAAEQSNYDPTVADIMKLIDHNFIHQHTTSFYAAKMGMTIKRINEVCIKGTGKTIKQHIQERLILEIKKEIRLNKKSLKEIAFNLGFNEPGYFTRFFKQHTALTPTEFKNS